MEKTEALFIVADLIFEKPIKSTLFCIFVRRTFGIRLFFVPIVISHTLFDSLKMQEKIRIIK